jgi:hypothetical protein
MPDPVAFEFETAKQLLRLLKKSKDGVFNSEVDDDIPLDHAPAFIWAYVPTTTTCTYDSTVKAWIINGATTCYPINSGVDAAGLMQWGRNDVNGIVTGGISCTTFTPKISSNQAAPSIGRGFHLGMIFGYDAYEQPRVLIGLQPASVGGGAGSTFEVVTGVVCSNGNIGVTTASLTTSDFSGAVFKNFLGLVDVVPKSFDGNANRIVMVNSTADALEFGPSFAGTPSAVDFLGLTDTPNNYSGALYKSVTCTASAVVFTTPNVTTTKSLSGGGNPNNASVFTSLELLNDIDGPGGNKFYGTTSGGVKGWRTIQLSTMSDFPSLTANAGKVLQVNSTSNGLQWSPLRSIFLTDFPNSMTGAANKFLKVNAGETAVEFADVDIAGMQAAISNLTARVTALES